MRKPGKCIAVLLAAGMLFMSTPAAARETLTVSAPPASLRAAGQYTKYDLLNPDTAVAAAAFRELASELCRELYNGYGFEREYGFSTGYNECRVMLATLNHDQGIRPEVLASEDALGGYTEEEVFNYSHTVSFGFMERATGSRVDFTKYMLNTELAEFINTMNELWRNYMDGDKSPYMEALREYCQDNNFENVENIDDYVQFYYMVANDYNTFGDRLDEYSVDVAQTLYDEHIVRPIYESYTGALPAGLLGDVDNSGEVDSVDASLVLVAAAALGLDQPSGLDAEAEKRADVDGNGNVNSVDASIILAYAAAQGLSDTPLDLIDYVPKS